MTGSPSPTETIYVRLLGEGSDAWAPAHGRKVGLMTFEIVAPPNCDPAAEEWEFQAGTIVVCELRTEPGGRHLLAVRRATAPPDVAATKRRVVEFVVREDPGYAPWIDTLIDGRPLEELVLAVSERTKSSKNLQGSEPHELLPPHGNLRGGHGRIQPLVCSGCREPGCHPVSAAIEVFDDVVVWSEFEEGNVTSKLPRLGPFVFDRKQYEAAVRRAVERDAAQDFTS